MTRIERKPTENAAAYTLYLKGRYLWNKRGIEDLGKAIDLFEQSVREDPGFAPSYVGLADCFLLLRSNWGVNVEINQEKARTMINKALELDPALAEAQATMGLILRGDYKLQEAEERYKKAIELKPSYTFGHMWYHNMLLDQLRWNEALDQIEKSLELDPLSPAINHNYAYYYYAKREYGKALELFKRVVQLDPGFVLSHELMALTNGKMGRFDDMMRNYEAVIRLVQDSFPLVTKAAEAQAAYFRNDKETVKKLLPELQTHIEQTNLLDSRWIAGFYFFLGEIDRGFEWLERSYAKREYNLPSILHQSPFDPIRSDPRYHDLLKRLKLSEALS